VVSITPMDLCPPAVSTTVVKVERNHVLLSIRIVIVNFGFGRCSVDQAETVKFLDTVCIRRGAPDVIGLACRLFETL
jgi:hypothetical protein